MKQDFLTAYKLTVSREQAAHMALGSHHNSMNDDRFLMKSAIDAAMSRFFFRPWRLIDSTHTRLSALAWAFDIAGMNIVDVQDQLIPFGIAIHPISISMDEFSEDLSLSCFYAPLKKHNGISCPIGYRVTKKDDYINVYSLPEDEAMDERIAYLEKRLNDGSTGLQQTGPALENDFGFVKISRRNSARDYRNEIIFPYSDAIIKVKRKSNSDEPIINFFKSGMATGKDYGFGSVFPTKMIQKAIFGDIL